MSKWPVSSEILLTHFFTICDTSFRFLCDEHDFRCYPGMVEFHHGRKIIKPFKNITKNSPFLAIIRLEKDEIAIEVTYDSHDLIIEAHVYYDFINRFSMGDILSAAKKMDAHIKDEYVMTSEHLITERIESYSQCIQAHPHLFTETDPKLMTRALKIRSKRMEQIVREQHNRNMSKAIERAAKAFQSKDYRRVVELYKPFESSLRASDKKKYSRAIDQLTSAYNT